MKMTVYEFDIDKVKKYGDVDTVAAYHTIDQLKQAATDLGLKFKVKAKKLELAELVYNHITAQVELEVESNELVVQESGQVLPFEEVEIVKEVKTVFPVISNAIQSATDELHKAFDQFNHALFDSELPFVALTIQTRGKHSSYGWFTPYTAWTDRENAVQLHEINISAETLNRPIHEVMRTLLHEMVHLYCHVNEIQDTSRNNTFHNKKFKEQSEAHGFFYDEPADKKYGWSFSKLTDETKDLIDSFDLDLSAFRVARSVPEDQKKKSNSFKWYCPHEGCKLNFRSSKKDIRVLCMDHDSQMVMDDNGEEDE